MNSMQPVPRQNHGMPTPRALTLMPSAVAQPAWWEGWVVGVSLFLLLTVVHVGCLDEPPYVEQAVGLWTEASYLADTRFDFAKLRFDELHVEVGGPRSYICTVIPSLLAGLMLVTDSAAMTIRIAHVATLVCAAVIGASLYSWLSSKLGRLRTGLILAAVYTLPAVAVQLEMVGLDMPLAAASMPFFALVRRRRWTAAALASWLAFAVKPSAFLLPLALVTYVALQTITRWLARRQFLDGWLWLGGLAAALCFIGQFLALAAADNLYGRVRWLADLWLWFDSIPELLLELLICALGTAWLLLRRQPRAAENSRLDLAAKLANWLEFDPLFAVAWIVVGGMIAAATGTFFETRHLLLVAPLTALIAGYLLAQSQRLWWQIAVLCIVISVHLANRFGNWYPELPNYDARGWGVPERSLEYRADHVSNREAVALLEAKHRGDPLLVTEIFTNFISLPRLGYISRSLTAPRPYCFAADDTEMWQLFDDQPDEVIVVRVESQLGRIPFPAYAIPLPAAGDELLDDDKLRPPRLVYRKRFARDVSPAERLRQYVDFLYSQSTQLDAVGRLVVVGNLAVARRLAALEKGWTETDPQLPHELLARLDVLSEQLATPSRMAADATYTAAELAAARQRLLEVVEQRRAELSSGKPVKSLEWGQRSLSNTLAQRLLYVPARSARD